jgi:methylmalonyl-CoA mutase N-terminal domain/subunit
MERAARSYIDRIDAMGGMIPAIERGFPQSEIADASYQYQRAIDEREQIIVGVNAFQAERDAAPNLLEIDERPAQEQAARLVRLRSRRNAAAVEQALGGLRRAASGTDNTMPYILEAVRAYATLGEICDALRDVFGTYQESSVI